VAKHNKAEPHSRTQPPRARAAQSRAADLDRLIHEPVRLGIVSALAVNDTMTFNELKELLKTTDGNLSVHARKLEEGQYLACDKYFDGRVPKTEYALTPLGRRVLDEAAQKLKEQPALIVEIEGHTDSIGTELYNLGLGKRRAEVVKGYLVLRHQVDPKRMTTLSYGEARPIADNRTREGRALNRRVEFKVLIR